MKFSQQGTAKFPLNGRPRQTRPARGLVNKPVERTTSSFESPLKLDAAVIGAGVAGLYQLHLLRSQGLAVRGFDAASDVGGTWYWNRYPGARVNSEGYIYQ